MPVQKSQVKQEGGGFPELDQPRCEINCQRGNAQSAAQRKNRNALRPDTAGKVRLGAGSAPQMRFDARAQFFQLKRLLHKIISARIKSLQPVFQVAETGQHHDRNVDRARIVADGFANLIPIDIG